MKTKRRGRKSADRFFPINFTSSEAAAFLATDELGLLRLVVDGVIERERDGTYDMDEVAPAYITHLRAEAGGWH